MNRNLASTPRGAPRPGVMTIATLIAATIPAQAQTAGTRADGDKRVCRSEGSTGTLMRRKTCHTKAQWVTIDRESEQAFQNRGTSNTVDRAQGGVAAGLDSFGQTPDEGRSPRD